jgi:hypothetical protein
MKTIIVVALCIIGVPALAQEFDESQTEGVQEMQIRLATMEQIDVTAEKEAVEPDEPLDEDIESILLEIEILEAEETQH